jgi:hypothetical protein
MKLAGLDLAGAATPTVTLQMNDNDLIVDYPEAGPSPLDTIKAQIKQAYNSGAWDMPGITTAMSDITTGPFAGKTAGLGYSEASALPGSPTEFGGQTIDATAVVIKYTFEGDAQLDGDVDLDDVGPWSVNFTGELGGGAGATKVWGQGDWDNDGDVDLDDVGKWSTNFTGELGGTGLGSTLDLGSAASSVHPTAMAALQSMGITVVPEPASLGLIGLGMAAASSRRRRTRTIR